MSDILPERELEFDFNGCVSSEKFDRKGKKRPQHLLQVDFVVEEKDRVLLFEVKDPSESSATEEGRKKFLEALTNMELIRNNLVPKARDTYTFLHLMKRDEKEFHYIVVLGIEAFSSISADFLLAREDYLKKLIAKECDEPWKRQYIKPDNVAVMTVQDFNKSFKYSVRRIAEA